MLKCMKPLIETIVPQQHLINPFGPICLYFFIYIQIEKQRIQKYPPAISSVFQFFISASTSFIVSLVNSAAFSGFIPSLSISFAIIIHCSLAPLANPSAIPFSIAFRSALWNSWSSLITSLLQGLFHSFSAVILRLSISYIGSSPTSFSLTKLKNWRISSGISSDVHFVFKNIVQDL